MIDMNDRFPMFRSRLRGSVESPEEAYLPSLDEYATPFKQAGFDLLKVFGDLAHDVPVNIHAQSWPVGDGDYRALD